jgi:D-serine deaminase-like pyridoxal phosphate-dependent protein
VGEHEILSVCDAVAAGRAITLTVDSVPQVEAISAVATNRGVTVPLCVDVDMSTDLPGLHFGVYRSPLRSPEDVVAFARDIAKHPNVRLQGVLSYEAQIAGIPDKVPARAAMNTLIRTLKRISVGELTRRRQAIISALSEVGFSLRFVNGGGTGSLETTRADSAVTELAAGSAFYAPGLFDGYSAFRHGPAAGFAVQIVRQPAKNIFTCNGGGYSASGAAGLDRLPKPFLPEGAKLLPREGAGEVQTPVQYDGPIPLKIGDPILFRHAKAGELCERFDKLLLISEGRVVDEVPTYRGEGQCFL